MSAATPEAGIGMTMLFQALVPALAAIASGLSVGFLTAHFQFRSFKRNWKRAREDMIVSHAISLIHDMATNLVRAAHAMWWLAWRATHAPKNVAVEQINEFELEIRGLLPKIHGLHAALQASHPEAARSLGDVVGRLDKLDLHFAKCSLAFRAGDPKPLRRALIRSKRFKRELPELIKGYSEEVAKSLGEPDGRKGKEAANV